MAIIWILEKPHHESKKLTSLLIGDFAVRVFASLKSVMRLCNSSVAPDLVIIRVSDFKDQIEDMKHFFLSKWDDMRIILIYPDPVQVIRDKDDNIECSFSEQDWFELPFLIQREISTAQDSIPRTRYLYLEDVCLDLSAKRLRIIPSEEWILVTPKEFDLLKIFMRNPEKCLKYEHFEKEVWRELKVSPSSVASQVSRLRKYLASSNLKIGNVYGGGYRLTKAESS